MITKMRDFAVLFLDCVLSMMRDIISWMDGDDDTAGDTDEHRK